MPLPTPTAGRRVQRERARGRLAGRIAHDAEKLRLLECSPQPGSRDFRWPALEGDRTIDANDRIRRKKEPFFSRLDDELLGLDTHAGLAYSLNQSAGRVWELIKDWTTIREVCDQLEQEYEVAHETCSSDVFDLVGRLLGAGLVEAEGTATR